MKKITFYDNDLSIEREKSLRQDMFENRDVEMSEWTSPESISDADVYEEWGEICSLHWDNFQLEMELFLQSNYCLMCGTVGTWRGNMKGGKFIQSLHDFNSIFRSCEHICVYEENGHFHIVASHHDGTNYMEMKVLTNRGMASAQHNMWDNDRALHERLWNSSTYTKLPRMARKYS